MYLPIHVASYHRVSMNLHSIRPKKVTSYSMAHRDARARQDAFQVACPIGAFKTLAERTLAEHDFGRRGFVMKRTVEASMITSITVPSVYVPQAYLKMMLVLFLRIYVLEAKPFLRLVL